MSWMTSAAATPPTSLARVFHVVEEGPPPPSHLGMLREHEKGLVTTATPHCHSRPHVAPDQVDDKVQDAREVASSPTSRRLARHPHQPRHLPARRLAKYLLQLRHLGRSPSALMPARWCPPLRSRPPRATCPSPPAARLPCVFHHPPPRGRLAHRGSTTLVRCRLCCICN